MDDRIPPRTEIGSAPQNRGLGALQRPEDQVLRLDPEGPAVLARADQDRVPALGDVNRLPQGRNVPGAIRVDDPDGCSRCERGNN